MTRLTLLEPTFAETLAGLRECGAGQRECVQYWCASQIAPAHVTRVVHPDHRSTPFGYEVDSLWVTRFFLDLRERHETAVCQIHTHPGRASHSDVDDMFALAPVGGFLSLVLPRFAMDSDGLDGCHLVEMQADGRWRQVDAEQVIRRV